MHLKPRRFHRNHAKSKQRHTYSFAPRGQPLSGHGVVAGNAGLLLCGLWVAVVAPMFKVGFTQIGKEIFMSEKTENHTHHLPSATDISREMEQVKREYDIALKDRPEHAKALGERLRKLEAQLQEGARGKA
ncbi:hypothetical protein NBRC3222_0497 [Acetobacter pasteurianus NBRC 3222]|nr:hypothetical protein NBRC3222_0497 [Acetobacter pasteurianus NBRC 3222]